MAHAGLEGNHGQDAVCRASRVEGKTHSNQWIPYRVMLRNQQSSKHSLNLAVAGIGMAGQGGEAAAAAATDLSDASEGLSERAEAWSEGGQQTPILGELELELVVVGVPGVPVTK